MSTPAYQTIIVKFREAITELDGIFRDMQFWGVATLKEWTVVEMTMREAGLPPLTPTRQS